MEHMRTYSQDELKDKELRREVSEVLAVTGHEYRGTFQVKHFIQVFKEERERSQEKLLSLFSSFIPIFH